jgi:aerobic carbon-monoxide dehydrogenase small subunit
MVGISVTIDGTRYDDDVEPRLLLVHYLRDRLGLTGTNIGCDTSNCGACTVLLDGHSAKSCTVLAVQADGSEVLTIQGLAATGAPVGAGAGDEASWHPLQRAFHTEHGLQCGYCTPGMIMASVDLLADNPDPSEDEVRHGLEGNLCRCTGYQNIVKAVRTAATEMRGATADTAEVAR